MDNDSEQSSWEHAEQLQEAFREGYTVGYRARENGSPLNSQAAYNLSDTLERQIKLIRPIPAPIWAD